jgi:glutathione-specific gamma-glutamylcyclotransferase
MLPPAASAMPIASEIRPMPHPPPVHAREMAGANAGSGLWVFGYGSLMWNPGFRFVECRIGTLSGYHRALCIYSHVHRGTPAQPGLVLGLDRGGACKGHAFRVASEDVAATIAYLRKREQATSVYLERSFTITLQDSDKAGGNESIKVKALTYVADRSHRQYAGRLPHEDVLRIVREGQGQSGLNPDYVLATHDHLATLGISDPVLARLAAQLRPTAQP